MRRDKHTKNKRKQVVKIVLYITALIGILPAIIIGIQYYNIIAQPVLSDLSTWLAHPALPAVFAILFSLGAALSIYLARKWFLILLLPLLYLALVPLFIAVDQQQSTQEPFLYYGQTEPGEGFNRYSKDSWTIKVEYPEPIKKAIKRLGKKPIIMTSLGGNGRHWEAAGFNAVYPFNYQETLKGKPQNWRDGFSHFFQVRNHHHELKGHRRQTTPLITKSPLDWPVKYKWFDSYIIVIPQV